jgi:membrane associated rhomboid family serine protease
MTLLSKLERRFGRYIPDNITKILIVGQVLSYVLVYANPRYGQYFLLNGNSLFRGEVWRLVTFLFGPTSESLIFVIFAWYFFYMLGTALENQWGSFRYLMYLLISYIGMLLFVIIFPDVTIANTYMYASMFLAFAHLFPNFQLLLFFIIPVKVKWLGYLIWFILLITLLFGSIPEKAVTVLSVINFFLFFHGDLRGKSHRVFRAASGSHPEKKKGKPLHICAVCGKNEIDNPDMEIRYCSKCFPETCYCGDHAQDHQHKRAVN